MLVITYLDIKDSPRAQHLRREEMLDRVLIASLQEAMILT